MLTFYLAESVEKKFIHQTFAFHYYINSII